MRQHRSLIMTAPAKAYRLLLSALPFFILAIGPTAQAVKPERILIRNVALIDQSGRQEDVIVNILVQNHKLKLVTKDDIPDDDVDLAFDARGGYLIGKLATGQAPSFMILDQDPRTDIQVMLDTDTHARFAMQEGVIVRNRLNRARAAHPQKKQGEWFAYSPPPVSLPVGYQSGSRWNQWESGWTNGILIGTVVLDRQFWPYQNGGSREREGDLSEYERGEIRALRLGVVGTLNFELPWVYTLFAATNAFDQGFDARKDKNISLLDWRLDIPLYEQTSLSLGKQKELISMERISSLAYLPWQERSAPADAFLPSRNIGVTISGNGFDQRMTWAGGVYNDWFDTGKVFNKSTDHYVGRLTWLPYREANEDVLLHLGVGLRYDDAHEEVRYKTRPEFYQAPFFVDTGPMAANGALTCATEVSYRMGPVWLAGEYIRSWVDAPELGDPVLDGYHVGISWVLTGEMRRYNKKNGTLDRYPVARSVYQGGPGAWEAATRWSSIDLADGAVSGSAMDILSAGVNWWLSSFFLTSINYRRIWLDNEEGHGISDGVNWRVMLMLE